MVARFDRPNYARMPPSNHGRRPLRRDRSWVPLSGLRLTPVPDAARFNVAAYANTRCAPTPTSQAHSPVRPVRPDGKPVSVPDSAGPVVGWCAATGRRPRRSPAAPARPGTGFRQLADQVVTVDDRQPTDLVDLVGCGHGAHDLRGVAVGADGHCLALHEITGRTRAGVLARPEYLHHDDAVGEHPLELVVGPSFGYSPSSSNTGEETAACHDVVDAPPGFSRMSPARTSGLHGLMVRPAGPG